MQKETVRIPWYQIDRDCKFIAEQYLKENKAPSTIIAIGRGGYIPGVILSHIFNCRIEPCYVSSYKGKKRRQIDRNNTLFPNIEGKTGTILIVDDLSDSGNTLQCIVEDCMDQISLKIKIKIATLYIKEKTAVVPDFYAYKFSTKVWLQFPWENP